MHIYENYCDKKVINYVESIGFVSFKMSKAPTRVFAYFSEQLVKSLKDCVISYIEFDLKLNIY